MKRRLILLDIVLIALIALMAVRFTEIREQMREREARTLNQTVKPEKMPALPPVAAPAPVAAAEYADIALKMLFSSDRNPTVILDPVAPPPEKPMPPLPVAYGAMFFGEPSIILSLPKAKAEQRNYHPGDTIGEFKLVSFDTERITFEWDGKTVQRRLDEIMSRAYDAPAVTPAQQAAATATTTPAQTTPVTAGPGKDNGDGNRACVAGDSSPSGTVIDGYKKLDTTTAFGRACRWEPVK